MSRYRATSFNPNLDLIVGWDPPLQTFFWQVFDLTVAENEDDYVTGGGQWTNEIPTLNELNHAIKEYGEVTTEILLALLKDQANTTQPTEFQKRMTGLVENIRRQVREGSE